MGGVCRQTKAGVVSFSGRPKVEIGTLFVSKKSKKLRLIVDARRANRLFKPPPNTVLGSVEAWDRTRLEPEHDLFVAQEHVNDLFYRLAIPTELGEYFGLPAVDPTLLRKALGARLPDSARHALLTSGRIHPIMIVLPMGFPWEF